MKLVKKISTQLLLASVAVVGLFGFAFANGGAGNGGGFTQPTDGNNTFTKTTDSASNIGVAKAGQADTGGAGGLIAAVKIAINWVLGLLALIALIICLYAGFKMLTAAGDAKAYGDGFTMLRQAGIGLIMIGISWLLVSFVFWVINLITNTQ
jgi:hypothetical protein